MTSDLILAILGTIVTIFAIGLIIVRIRERAKLRKMIWDFQSKKEELRETYEGGELPEGLLLLIRPLEEILTVFEGKWLFPLRTQEVHKVFSCIYQLIDTIFGWLTSMKSNLEEIEREIKKSPPDETGNILLEVLFFLVPALISLAFTGALIYLLVTNNTIDYKAPEALTKPLSIIIGYYFGVGASSIAKREKIA